MFGGDGPQCDEQRPGKWWLKQQADDDGGDGDEDGEVFGGDGDGAVIGHHRGEEGEVIGWGGVGGWVWRGCWGEGGVDGRVFDWKGGRGREQRGGGYRRGGGGVWTPEGGRNNPLSSEKKIKLAQF